MRKYFLLFAATLALATYEAAYACGNHNKTKTELQAQFPGGSGRRIPGVGGVKTTNRGPSSAMDEKFFDKLNLGGATTGSAFSSAVSTDEAPRGE